MKIKRIAAFGIMVLLLALFCALATCAHASLSMDDKALVLSHVAEDYPDWKVSFATAYGSGKWQDELARHVNVGLYRTADDMLIQKTLHVLANPLWVGEEIRYDEEDIAPVPIASLTVDWIEKLTQEEAEQALGGWIDVERIPWCAEFLLKDDEQWKKLGAFSDKLIGLAADQEGIQRIVIAYWNGQSYDRIISSPAQAKPFFLNEVHSGSNELELMVDDGLVYVSCAGDTPHIGGINTGWGVWSFGNDFVWNVGDGVSNKSSNQCYPGVPTFPLLLTEMDLSLMPLYNSSVLAFIDASGWACVRENGAPMRDAPEGTILASCYARLFGRIKEERDGWVLMQIGGERYGMTGWFCRKDLAFGQDGFSVPCGFPSYAYEDAEAEHLNEALKGLLSPLSEDDSPLAWLIGKKQNGDWLVLVDADIVCTAAMDAFSEIGKPEEYIDPRYSYDWDEDDLRTLEYIEEDTGLLYLRIIMDDAVFVRDSFPPHCYLDTFYDDSEVFIDWYPNLPDGPVEDWPQVLNENHPISLIFHFQEEKWSLKNATDWRTWDMDAENGHVVFYEYDDPYNAEWQWSATLDDNLMTFDFLKLETLVDQYNAATPDRPSVAGDEG